MTYLPTILCYTILAALAMNLISLLFGGFYVIFYAKVFWYDKSCFEYGLKKDNTLDFAPFYWLERMNTKYMSYRRDLMDKLVVHPSTLDLKLVNKLVDGWMFFHQISSTYLVLRLTNSSSITSLLCNELDNFQTFISLHYFKTIQLHSKIISCVIWLKSYIHVV